MDIQEILKSLGLSVARGVPQMASGFVDLAALPFTATGLLKPEQAVGSTDWMTARGYLPPKQEGLLSESAEMASSMLSPAGATKAGLLALGMAATKGKGGKALNSILKTQYDEAMEVAQKNAALPVSEGGLGLPPDNTAMDRAKAMGFDSDTFHGTSARFDNFDLSKANPRSQYMPGIFTADSPALANNFGDYVMPLMQRKGTTVLDKRTARAAGLPLPQVDTIHDAAAGIRVTNNPSNIRSRFAAFDPKRIDENNLLASLLASLGVGGLLYTPDEEEQY